MKQGSKEWFEARKGMITGSRIGAILGKSKFAKQKDVLREMVREYFGADREFTGNIATRWGNDHEPVARQDAIIDISNSEGEEIYCEEVGFTVHPHVNWLGVSPDGLLGLADDENGSMLYGLEIKCPFSKKIKEVIPDDHYCQMQLCMAVYGVDSWWYYQWTPTHRRMENVAKDSGWLAHYIEELAFFMEDYLSIIGNKELAKPFLVDLTKEIDSAIWKESVNDYLVAKLEHDRCTKQLDFAKTQLIEIAKTKNVSMCYGDGVSVTKVIKKGSIKYRNIGEIKDVDLEKYRDKDSVYYRVGEKK